MTTVAMTLGEIETLTRQVFLDNGCDDRNREALVRTVVSAERDGSHSHGLFRVPGYVAGLRSGKVNGRARPDVTQRSPVALEIDADNGYAPLALEVGLPALADKALEFGLAMLGVRNAFHYAALWPEVEQLAARSLVALACVNYIPVVAPHGGREAQFGTNPLAFAWPRPGADPVVFDMATSAMAQGDVQIAARDGRDVPAGTGLDASGQPSTDPRAILEGVLLAFGGHKGSAIALMVELLTAGMTGDYFSFEAQQADSGDGGPVRGGEFILAMSPEVLGGEDWAQHCEGFHTRLESNPDLRIPGQRRHRNRQSATPRAVNKALAEEIRGLCKQL